MDKILNQILEGQNKLFQEVSGLKEGQNQLFQEVSGLKNQVSNIKDGQQQIIIRMDKLETDMATSIQQKENTLIIKGIMHNTEKLSADLNELKLNTLGKEALSHIATKEDISKLNSKFEVLNSRLFHQEAELYELKAVK